MQSLIFIKHIPSSSAYWLIFDINFNYIIIFSSNNWHTPNHFFNGGEHWINILILLSSFPDLHWNMNLPIEMYKSTGNFIGLKYVTNSAMARISWKISKYIRYLFNFVWLRFNLLKMLFLSIFHNEFADWYYIGDTLMEPMFWFVDHFTKILGPVSIDLCSLV